MPTAYITAPPEDAQNIAMVLVEEGYAACVNRFSCDSLYRWDGEIHMEEEVVLLAKTTAEGFDALEERVLDVHPDEVPCIERFDEDDVHEAFAEWRAEATTYEDAESELDW